MDDKTFISFVSVVLILFGMNNIYTRLKSLEDENAELRTAVYRIKATIEKGARGPVSYGPPPIKGLKGPAGPIEAI